MRTATVAKLSFTAMVGLGTLIGSAGIAQAGPGPVKQGSLNGGPVPTTSTTVKDLSNDNIGVAYCDVHLCLDAEEVDPTPPTPPKLPGDKIALPDDDDCNTPACDLDDKIALPGDDDCNLTLGCDDLPIKDSGCQWTHGCPQDEGGTGGGTGGSDGGTEGTDGGGTEGTDGGGSDGQTDGGTQGTDGETSDGGQSDGGTGGSGGRLPKTGGDIVAIAGTGLGLTGIGAALRRFSRRRNAED